MISFIMMAESFAPSKESLTLVAKAKFPVQCVSLTSGPIIFFMSSLNSSKFGFRGRAGLPRAAEVNYPTGLQEF